MLCPLCLNGPSARKVDMSPGRDPAVLHCLRQHCPATVGMVDLGFRPALFTPLPGPALTPSNEKQCRLPACGLWFVPSRGASYCSESCRFQARQAARKTYVTPNIQQRSERTARILAKVSSALAFADPSDQGWTQC